MRITRLVPLAAAVLSLPACGGDAGSDADKAGGSTGPVVLRLAAADGADQPESQQARYYAAQVAALSGGKLRVRVTFQAAGNSEPDVEVRTARLVEDGRFDLGWIGARAWDGLGVTSFQALQAPFLITSYPLLQRVVESPLAGEMLAGLARRDLVGLALIPGLLRHPVGIRRPLVAIADFQGARVRDQPSAASDALLTALGAVPVHVGNRAIGREVGRGRVDGQEVSLLNAPIGGIVAANVAFFPKTLTLFASGKAFERLTDEQRRILRAAADRTLHHASDFPLRAALGFEGALARQYCRTPGRIVLATGPELAALRRAARPVYTVLERDAPTRRLIARIQDLASTLPTPPPVVVPRSCLGPRPDETAAATTSPSTLNGTYHRLLTAAGARAFGATGNESRYPLVITTVLRDGRWTANSDDPPDTGTYTVSGNRVVFDLGGDVMRFTFSRDDDGTLHLRPILPMDPGDQWIMAGAPWRRVGPPS